ncbi:spore coat protein [Neobacillus sp. Marseille-QA0830]
MSTRRRSNNKFCRDFEESPTFESPEQSFEDNNNNNDAVVAQDADQVDIMEQDSDELIFIKDSCNIWVHTTDTQAAVSIQLALQLAIALVIRITILDSDDSNGVVQDLVQFFDSEQKNKQRIVIDNSKDVKITTTDTDISVNIQALLQVLLSLVAKLDIA